MSNIGIIAEYNPYHNGHKYLVKNAIKETDADGVIALMSGNFIQRGAPAMADKYSDRSDKPSAGKPASFRDTVHDLQSGCKSGSGKRADRTWIY